MLQPLFEGLGINLSGFIAQFINFGILFLVLYLVAYKPLMRMFDERSRRIKESIDQTEQIKAQAASAEEEVKKQMEASRKDGQEIVARALRTADEIRQKAQQEAKQEGENIIANARAAIQQERDEAITEIRSEFADLTITAAEKVIDRSLDKEAHRDIIDKVLEQSKPKQG